jgi:hypothetical protein
MDLKPPAGPTRPVFNLTRFQVGVVGALVIALGLAFAQRMF